MLPNTLAEMSGVQEWEQLVFRLVRDLEKLNDQVSAPLRIWVRNTMEALVLATSPGMTIASGSFKREEVLMYSALFQALLAFRETPIPVYLDEHGEPVLMTPEQILGYRRMPLLEPQPLGGGSLAAGGAYTLTTNPGQRLVSTLPLSAVEHTAKE